MRFFEGKGHSLSVAPEPIVIWNKKLEGLESLLLEKLKISSKNIYPAAPEHISGFFCSRRTRIEGLLSCSQVAYLLSEVGGRWWLSVNAAQSRVVQCWYILPDIPSLGTVSSCVVAFPFECFVKLDLLVHLFHVHHSGVHEEVCPALHQECHCLGLGSCSEVPLPKIAEEVESQEYLDAIEEAEPEVDELAEKVAENLNINISSPDDNV